MWAKGHRKTKCLQASSLLDTKLVLPVASGSIFFSEYVNHQPSPQEKS